VVLRIVQIGLNLSAARCYSSVDCRPSSEWLEFCWHGSGLTSTAGPSTSHLSL